MRWNRNLAEEGADPTSLLFLRKWARERKRAELAGREYDRVLLISMANARFTRYLLADEFTRTSRSRAA
jgi:hypothetical protein